MSGHRRGIIEGGSMPIEQMNISLLPHMARFIRVEVENGE
jgi:hypothetical protein